MNTAKRLAQSRGRLDGRLTPLQPVARFQAPARGWIRAIREALGMTTAQLATRMGVRQPTVMGLERSESNETIQLSTLRRAAEALDCTLVYALVPNQPLETTVRARARAVLEERRQPVAHTMLLEDQDVPGSVTSEQVDEALREMNPRRFWD